MNPRKNLKIRNIFVNSDVFRFTSVQTHSSVLPPNMASPLRLPLLVVLLCVCEISCAVQLAPTLSPAFGSGNLTQCVSIPASVTFCSNTLTYPISAALDTIVADNRSLVSYRADLAIWSASPNLYDCSQQVVGSTMCNDCLASRRLYWCAVNFPRCTDGVTAGEPMCKYLCEDTNRRCDTCPLSDSVRAYCTLFYIGTDFLCFFPVNALRCGTTSDCSALPLTKCSNASRLTAHALFATISLVSALMFSTWL